MTPRSTESAIGLPPAEAIAFLRQKTNTTSERWTDLWNEAHSRGFMVAGAASQALVADFRGAVAKALETGSTLAEFRNDFDSIVAKHGWSHNGSAAWRSQIIYETNLSTAYSAGRYAQMTEPDTLRVYPYWQYQHTSSARPRPAHLAWVGTTLRYDDPWWSTHYPPNGWRCRCSVRPVSGAGLRRQGKTGPDTAPEVTYRPFTIKPSSGVPGRVVEVPNGIDPGFGYNPGAAWRGEPPPSGGGSRGPTAPDMPAPKRPTRLPPAEAVEPPRGIGPREPPPEIASIPAPPDPHDLLPALVTADAPVEVGMLHPDVQRLLGADGGTVLLSPETMAKQIFKHGELRADEYAQLPKMLSHPAAVASSFKARHLVLLRWHGRVLYLVVKTTRDGRETFVQSFRRANPRDLQKIRASGILLGSLDNLGPDRNGGK